MTNLRARITIMATVFIVCITSIFASKMFVSGAGKAADAENIYGKGGYSGASLHYDQNADNYDIYYENWSDTPDIVRLRLYEYLEIGEYQTPVVSGSTSEDISTWLLHIPGETTPVSQYRSWILGGQKYYYPTPNELRGSVINGSEFIDTLTPANIRPGDVNSYGAGAKITLNSVAVITTGEWVESGAPIGNFWVYDSDGWAYWANVLNSGEATGLLIDGVNISAGSDESYTYWLQPMGQVAAAYLDGNNGDNVSNFGLESWGGWTANGKMLVEQLTLAGGADSSAVYANNTETQLPTSELTQSSRSTAEITEEISIPAVETLGAIEDNVILAATGATVNLVPDADYPNLAWQPSEVHDMFYLTQEGARSAITISGNASLGDAFHLGVYVGDILVKRVVIVVNAAGTAITLTAPPQTTVVPTSIPAPPQQIAAPALTPVPPQQIAAPTSAPIIPPSYNPNTGEYPYYDYEEGAINETHSSLPAPYLSIDVQPSQIDQYSHTVTLYWTALSDSLTYVIHAAVASADGSLPQSNEYVYVDKTRETSYTFPSVNSGTDVYCFRVFGIDQSCSPGQLSNPVAYCTALGAY
ncbi:MAG: hypothetical protein LBL96_12290 [Clostridiales bacterium]|jgi:hypothetical protein|nr:hypothetical protein [Clostridiales bacterium]